MIRSVWFRFTFLAVAGGYHLALRRPVTAQKYLVSARTLWWLYGPAGRAHGVL